MPSIAADTQKQTGKYMETYDMPEPAQLEQYSLSCGKLIHESCATTYNRQAVLQQPCRVLQRSITQDAALTLSVRSAQCDAAQHPPSW